MSKTLPTVLVVDDEVRSLEALRRSSRRADGWDRLKAHCAESLQRHEAYVREHLEDMPEVRSLPSFAR